MHKQEILAAFTEGANDGYDGCYDSNKEQYYQEKFVSKGSDDHISDISKMVEDETQPTTYKVDTWTSFHHDKERIINALISDEEIQKAIDAYFPKTDINARWGWKLGAEWYREQLKSK
jgi:hypothetical protein